MSERDSYPAGVPCWVETLQRDTARGAAVLRLPVRLADRRLRGGRLRGRAPARPRRRRHRRADRPGLARGLVHERPRRQRSRTPCAPRRPPGRTVLHAADRRRAGRAARGDQPTRRARSSASGRRSVREGAQVINEPGAWAMSALQTADVDAARAFYGSVFGWQAEAFGPATLLRLPGFVGGTPTAARPPRRRRRGRRRRVRRASALGRRLLGRRHRCDRRPRRRAGRQRLQGPFDRPPFRSAVLADGAGASFSISQLRADLRQVHCRLCVGSPLSLSVV